MTATKYAALAPNPIAVELGLDDPNGPTAVLAQVIANGSKDETNVLYMYLLDAWEKVFDNELDQSTLEEHTRWFFGKQVSVNLDFRRILELMTLVAGISGVHAGQNSYCNHQAGNRMWMWQRFEFVFLSDCFYRSRVF